jgi:hypothetical protein
VSGSELVQSDPSPFESELPRVYSILYARIGASKVSKLVTVQEDNEIASSRRTLVIGSHLNVRVTATTMTFVPTWKRWPLENVLRPSAWRGIHLRFVLASR